MCSTRARAVVVVEVSQLLLMTSNYLIEERIETQREPESGRSVYRERARASVGSPRFEGGGNRLTLVYATARLEARVGTERGSLLAEAGAQQNDARTSESDQFTTKLSIRSDLTSAVTCRLDLPRGRNSRGARKAQS